MARIDREMIAQDFIALTQIDSESFHERKMVDTIKARMEELGFEVIEDKANEVYGSEAGNLYGYLPGNIKAGSNYADTCGIILSGHLDTVSPGIGKKAIRHADGRITSDGTTVLGADDLSGVVAILHALKYVIEEGLPRRDIELVFTVAEEAYVKGAKVFDTSRLKHNQVYVFDMSGPVGAAAVQAPAIIRFEATVTGRAAHAGFEPERGIHAIQIAADAISRIRMGHTTEVNTFNVGLVSGGEATNIVPESCVIVGEARGYDFDRSMADIDSFRKELAAAISRATGDGLFQAATASGEESQTTDTATAHINPDLDEQVCECFNSDGVGYSIKVEVMQKGYKMEPDMPAVQRFTAIASEVGVSGRLEGTFGGSDLNVFANQGLTGLVIASGMNNVHSTAEWTTVDELALATEIAVKLIQPR